jgi:hypothetical protein
VGRSGAVVYLLPIVARVNGKNQGMHFLSSCFLPHWKVFLVPRVFLNINALN